MRKHTHTEVRQRRIQGKVDPLQAQLLTSNNMGELRNNCCFSTVLPVSQESPSLVLKNQKLQEREVWQIHFNLSKLIHNKAHDMSY